MPSYELLRMNTLVLSDQQKFRIDMYKHKMFQQNVVANRDGKRKRVKEIYVVGTP